MRRPKATSVALALALLVLAPSAWAQWSSKGETEPNTAYDTGWRTPPVPSTTTAVYFNGFAGAWAGAPTSANPNLATGSRVQPYPYAPSALLGVWVDCDRDGYIGNASLGAIEYSSRLLPPHHICNESRTTTSLSHNDGDWVQEFFPIGYDDVRTTADENPFNLRDQGARVWADWGAPGAAPTTACGDVPLPRGTLRSTGAMAGLVDCRLGRKGVATWNEAARAAGRDDLSFRDAPAEHPERSSSPLNVANPWGHERDATMVKAVDCEGPMTPVGVSDPTDNGSGNGKAHSVTVMGITFNLTDSRGRFVNASVRPLAPDVDDAGSPAGTVNESQAGTSDCRRDDRDSVLTYEGEQRGSDGGAPYLIETSADPVYAGEPRRRTDFAFTFEEGVRDAGTPAASLLGRRWQTDAGTGAVGTLGTWVATGRDTRLPARGDLGAAPASLITFYAHVSQGVTDALGLEYGGPGGFYGTPCGAVYLCDATQWWRNAEGADVVPRDARLGAGENPAVPKATAATEIGVRTGQRFVARDTDCYAGLSSAC